MKELIFLFIILIPLNTKTTLFNCSTHSYIASSVEITASQKNYNEIALNEEILTLINMRHIVDE